MLIHLVTGFGHKRYSQLNAINLIIINRLRKIYNAEFFLHIEDKAENDALIATIKPLSVKKYEIEAIRHVFDPNAGKISYITCTDYLRYKALAEYGGLYVDLDVLPLHFYDFSKHKAWVYNATKRQKSINCGIMWSAEPGQMFFTDVLANVFESPLQNIEEYYALSKCQQAFYFGQTLPYKLLCKGNYPEVHYEEATYAFHGGYSLWTQRWKPERIPELHMHDRYFIHMQGTDNCNKLRKPELENYLIETYSQ